MKNERENWKGENGNYDRNHIRNINEYSCILFSVVMFCLPTLVLGESIAMFVWNRQLLILMYFLLFMVVFVALCIGICCLRKNNTRVHDVEKCELEPLIHSESSTENNTASIVAENYHHFSAIQYMDPATIVPSFIEISNCSH